MKKNVFLFWAVFICGLPSLAQQSVPSMVEEGRVWHMAKLSINANPITGDGSHDHFLSE